MLGDENRMAPHGRLPAVVFRLGRGQALDDELPRVLQNDRQTFLDQISLLLRSKPETTANLLRDKAENNSSASRIFLLKFSAILI